MRAVFTLFLFVGLYATSTCAVRHSTARSSIVKSLSAKTEKLVQTPEQMTAKKISTSFSSTLSAAQMYAAVSSLVDCHYNLFLANYETEGFGGATVQILNGAGMPVTGFETGVTYSTTMKEMGFYIPVIAGDQLFLKYTSGSLSGNQVWVKDATGATVFADMDLATGVYALGNCSCVCSYITDASACPAVRSRNEWRSLSYCDQVNFLSALQVARQETTATGENYYDIYITHHNSNSGKIIDKSEFLPWHRGFLMVFEDHVRGYGGNFTCLTIPYWDWSLDFANESLSPIYAPFGQLREESCLGAPYDYWTDPTIDSCVYRRHAGWIKEVWAPSSYPNFASESAVQLGVTVNNTYAFIFKFLVRNPHKSVHNYVGGALGSMSKLSSPADPLFWLHHANIDRIWALWQDCWDYDQPGMEEAQWADLTWEKDAGLDDPLVPIWPNTTTTSRSLLSLAALNVSYPPMFENWAQLNGNHEVYAPTFCKWDWFSAEQKEAAGITWLPGTHSAYQRDRHTATVDAYRATLATSLKATASSANATIAALGPEYYSALLSRMQTECAMGNAFHSDDFADMFNDQMDLNAKIGPSYLFRHVCKLLYRDDLHRLFVN